MDQITGSGRVDAFLVAEDGTRQQVVGGANTLLYRCADAVARLFAGSVDYVPTTIGFVVATTDDKGTAFNFTPGTRTNVSQSDVVGTGLPVKDTVSQSDVVGTGLSVKDIAIDQLRRFSTSAATYSGNVVTLSAQTTDNGDAEYVYGFLLKDAAGRLLAVKKLDEPVQRTAGYALAASWAVTFS